MKKRICALTAALLLLLSMAVSAAEPRMIRPTYSLAFSGTTATCKVNIRADSSSDKISATAKLWDGGACLKTWTDSGTGALSFSETHSKGIKSGKSYTMTVDYKHRGQIRSPAFHIRGLPKLKRSSKDCAYPIVCPINSYA